MLTERTHEQAQMKEGEGERRRSCQPRNSNTVRNRDPSPSSFQLFLLYGRQALKCEARQRFCFRCNKECHRRLFMGAVQQVDKVTKWVSAVNRENKSLSLASAELRYSNVLPKLRYIRKVAEQVLSGRQLCVRVKSRMVIQKSTVIPNGHRRM